MTGFVNFRGEKMIQYESTLERDFVLLQEFSLPVLEVVSQPCAVPFVAWDGRTYTYTPDFFVAYHTSSAPHSRQTKPLLVEVKPREDWELHWREWLPKWKAARRYAIDNGWRFRIMDESRIRTVALENINFLARFARLQFDALDSERIIEDLREMGSATFEHLLVKYFRGPYQAQGIPHLWHLLVTRRLECDISFPLSNQTELWVPDEI